MASGPCELMRRGGSVTSVDCRVGAGVAPGLYVAVVSSARTHVGVPVIRLSDIPAGMAPDTSVELMFPTPSNVRQGSATWACSHPAALAYNLSSCWIVFPPNWNQPQPDAGMGHAGGGCVDPECDLCDPGGGPRPHSRGGVLDGGLHSPQHNHCPTPAGAVCIPDPRVCVRMFGRPGQVQLHVHAKLYHAVEHGGGR